MDKQKTKNLEVVKVESRIEDEKKPQVESNPGSVSNTLPAKKSQLGLTQREAVYAEVMALIRTEKLNIDSSNPIKPILTEKHMKTICISLVSGFKTKKITLKDTDSNRKKLSDEKTLELYCLGLLNNWLRRDNRLNGAGNIKK